MAMKRDDFLNTLPKDEPTDTKRKPDYTMKAMDRRASGKSMSSKVGVAWKNPDGSISVDLLAFITLETVTRTPNDLVITLFPTER